MLHNRTADSDHDRCAASCADAARSQLFQVADAQGALRRAATADARASQSLRSARQHTAIGRPLPRARRQKSSCPEVSGAGSSGYPALQRCSSALQRCKLHRCSATVLAAPRGAEAARSLRFQGRASAPGSHDRRDRLDGAPPTFGSASPTRHTPQALLPGGTPVQGRAAACSVLQHCPPAYHGRRLHRCRSPSREPCSRKAPAAL